MMDLREALDRTISEDRNDHIIRVEGIMKDGDFLVYYDQGAGFIMYHACDGMLWRTMSDSLRGLSPDRSELVEGLSYEDTKLPLVRYGSNFGL